MSTQKDDVAALIARAKTELEQALDDLESLPTFDPGTLNFAAHSLYNYLNVAGGTVDLLAVKLEDYPDPEIHFWLDGLRHATRLMLHTANQMMGAAAATGPELVYREMSFRTLARRACDYYQKVAERKLIVILFESAVESPYVRTDGIAVAAILDNLLSNAVKYSPSAKQIWVRLDTEGDTLVCSVRDEGPGISRKEQAKLFRRGVRLSAVPTGGESSTGYGLAVASELAARVGGEVRCESELGHGACFSLRLPAARPIAPDDSVRVKAGEKQAHATR